MNRSHPAGKADGFMAANMRRNFIALALDYGFFGLGMSFVSTTTILPALADRLGAPNLILGALPSIVMLGRSVPALFSARLIEPMPRKLPFVLAYTAWERLPWLLLAVAVYGWSTTNPVLVLALLVGILTAVALTGGVLSPAWVDLVARVIPTEYRGRFFAIGGAFATLSGVDVSALSNHVRRHHRPPLGPRAPTMVARGADPRDACDETRVGILILCQAPACQAQDDRYLTLTSHALKVRNPDLGCGSLGRPTKSEECPTVRNQP